MNLSYRPPNLCKLGLKRATPNDVPDLVTIWKSPYPVLLPYMSLCAEVGWNPYANGTYKEQGEFWRKGYITSGYRDNIIEGNYNSPHHYAFAIDISTGSMDRQIEVALKARYKYARIGLYHNQNFIHVDAAPYNWIEHYNKANYWVKRNGVYHYFESFGEMIDFAQQP